MRVSVGGRQLCCGGARERLSPYLDDELCRRERAWLEHQLAWCPRCQRMLGNLRRTVVGLRRLGAPGVRQGR